MTLKDYQSLVVCGRNSCGVSTVRVGVGTSRVSSGVGVGTSGVGGGVGVSSSGVGGGVGVGSSGVGVGRVSGRVGVGTSRVRSRVGVRTVSGPVVSAVDLLLCALSGGGVLSHDGGDGQSGDEQDLEGGHGASAGSSNHFSTCVSNKTMAIFSDFLVVDILLAVTTLLGILYYYLTSNYDYWKKRGVPYVKPQLLFGNVKDQFLMRKQFARVIQDIYNDLSGEKFGGYFEMRTPVLMVRDSELIERILIKDFSYFSDRGFGNPNSDPLAGNLVNLKGDVWRNLRNKLTPTFTTGKLKGMFEQISNCGDYLLNEIEKKSSNNEAMDAKLVGTTFSIDVISSCAFGLQFKPDSPEGILFRKMVSLVFAPSSYNMIKMFTIMFCKPLAKMLGLRQFNTKVSDYMIDLVKTTVEFREKNNIHRNDFLQLMMNLKTQEETGKVMNWKKELSEEDAYLDQMDYSMRDDQQENGIKKIITYECIAAQSLVFLTGGSETVANSVCYTLYELACNPELQKRLQQQIDSVINKHGGKLTYEGLKEMIYLDMVIQERNRKYSEGAILRRICGASYTIPGTDIVIEKGMKVVIPVCGIHNDPAHYPEPDKFIPERFEGNNHRTSGTYLPFGDGPRVCIAMRFAILELKACIAKIMSEYSVTLDPRTKVPLQFDTKTFSLTPVGGIWVKFQKRTSNSS